MSKELPFMVLCLEEYKNEMGITGKEALSIFRQYSVFDYIKEFYESLHTAGMNYILEDIDQYIQSKKSGKNKQVHKIRTFNSQNFSLLLQFVSFCGFITVSFRDCYCLNDRKRIWASRSKHPAIQQTHPIIKSTTKFCVSFAIVNFKPELDPHINYQLSTTNHLGFFLSHNKEQSKPFFQNKSINHNTNRRHITI